MEHILYWLWLTTKQGITPAKITILMEYFETIESVYISKSFNNIYGITDLDKNKLCDKDLSNAKRVVEKIAKLNAKIVVFDDENYPELLKNIPNPPYVLYIQGAVPELDKVLTIGVVGTRKTTDYGRIVTERICRDLAKDGVVTVGGLAKGIDAVGAWATLDAGGMAVGVIGNGLDIVYPKENAELINAVAHNGCVLTEYAPGTPPISTNFPVRNRIIAGISRGVLVTEAPEKSGALITARYALDNCRDVFAVPRAVTDTKYLGTNIIIQQGAKLVNNAADIICEYPYAVKITPKERKIEEIKPKVISNRVAVTDDEKYDKLNQSEKDIIDILKKKDTQIDEISRELQMPVGELNQKLIMLEVKGFVKKLPGSGYQLKI